MRQKNNILFVANLQVYATPYASLYVDMNRKTMLMFVRVSKPSDSEIDYIAADITPQQLEGYMEQRIGLKDIYKPTSYKLARINGGKVYIEKPKTAFQPTREFVASNVFDPEYFHDDLEVLSFMDRMSENKVFA